MQWADFAGGKGQFVDVSGSYYGTRFKGISLNRTGGNVTADFYTCDMWSARFRSDARQKACRCGSEGLQVGRASSSSPPHRGPKGMEPRSTSTITADREARSTAAVGGTVTAKLTARRLGGSQCSARAR